MLRFISRPRRLPLGCFVWRRDRDIASPRKSRAQDLLPENLKVATFRSPEMTRNQRIKVIIYAKKYLFRTIDKFLAE
ncbi:hypothetical protein IQ270_25170 [Microcoleus sp. LEGE 07076]|uniref:hypothetical protein n=1 Tax=Microcoleus sp. LEGE 07076 TaxID=915322 RepID=UPI001882BD75|nr:hypothetical protein [Microcoleus sp. LEGE 07076]MBE9187843.1 hypothetical protein [Microcoleus sp. LEGE 07076]